MHVITMRSISVMLAMALFGLTWIVWPRGATAAGLGGVDPESPVLTVEQTIAEDTQWYADRYGVNFSEATRRLGLQPEISKLQRSLRKHENDTFAGLWLEHSPDYRVVVRFTESAEETIQGYVQGGPLEGMVEVRGAEFSEASLAESQHAVIRLAKEIEIDNDSSIDVRSNRIEFNVLDAQELSSKLQSVGAALPATVYVSEVDSLAKPMADIFGGLALSECTSGFSVIDGTDEGVTTAGHCGNSLSYNGTNLTFESGTTGGTYDIQWHSTTSFTVRNLVHDGTYNRYIYDEELREDQYVGQDVCMYGKTSGGNCGEILSTTFDDVNVKTDISVAGGDSGGPFFWNNTAFGTTISAVGSDSVYGPVDHIHNILGLDLMFN